MDWSTEWASRANAHPRSEAPGPPPGRTPRPAGHRRTTPGGRSHVAVRRTRWALARPARGGYAAPVIAIVGAGAAGLATAIFAARRGAPGPIVLLDGAARPGREDPGERRLALQRHERRGRRRPTSAARPPHLVRRVLQRVRRRRDGRLLPRDRRRAARGGARQALPGREPLARRPARRCWTRPRRRGVVLRAGERVEAVERRPAAGFVVRTTREELAADAGRAGHGRALAAEDGQRRPRLRDGRGAGPPVVPDDAGPRAPRPRPARSTRRCPAWRTRSSSRCARPGARPCGARGSLLWTHFGVSGPVVLDVSRALAAGAARGPRADGRGQPASRARLRGRGRRAACGGRPRARASAVARALSRWLPAAVAEAVAARGGRRRDAARPPAPRGAARARARPRRPPLPVVDSRGYGFAEATAGGVPLAEVDPRTMESRRLPGALPGGRDARRGRPDRRLQLPVGVVERVGGGGRPRARAVIVSRAGKGVGRAGIPLRRPGSRPGRRLPLLRPAAGGRPRRLRLRAKPAGRRGRGRGRGQRRRPSPTSRRGCARGRRSPRWRASSARRARTAGRRGFHIR